MDLNPEVYYLSVESVKKWTLIIDSGHFFDFFYFMVIFSHFGLWGAFWRPSWAPAMAYCVLPVPIWSWVPKCAILGDQWAKKMLIYNNCSVFGIFGIFCIFWSIFGHL